jgi:NAD+ synthase (glutamine-hydrolysing)
LTFKLGETVFGVSICEDIWYPDGPPHLQANEGGATLLINISASPYHINKGEVRERMLATRAADTLTFVAYCNLVGGQDELVFDGQSMIFGPQGEILARAAQFTEDMLVADIDTLEVLRARLVDRRRSSAGRSRFEQVSLAQVATRSKRPLHPCLKAPLARAAESYEALKLATRDYVLKNGFHKVVLGLSGGIDSSLVAAIAADALGPENVTGVAMPTRYSSEHSIEDARQLADNFGLHFLTIPIDATFESFLQMLAPACGEIRGLPEENIQPRIRGTVLMALSNHFGWLVLTTGNKSENSVGYSTLYGDTAGGFAVIKDVSKMLVYELARHRNQIAGHDVIPERVLTKAPSAELRPDQKDSDSLPEYEVLDPILRAYVEERCSAEEIVLRGFASDVVARVIRLVQISEYKRRQSPPGVKITPRAFGKDWRLPITKSIARATHRAG